jgi:hypothetical protein
MSDAQVLYLQGLTNKKLSKKTDCLRKDIAHQGLHMRLSEAALDQAIKEDQNRLAVGDAKWMRTFEDNMAIRTFTERLTALTLKDSTNS